MIAAHLFILASWLLMWVVFYGWGSLACAISRCRRDDGLARMVNPWIGVACVLGLLQVWNLAAPVNTWAFVVVAGIGMLAAIVWGARQGPQVWAAARTDGVLFAIGLILVAYFANRSLNTQQYPDHGLYYLNAIRWASDYSIVPGLANLHSRLAFNNSNFLLHAMMEVATGRGYSAHVVNGFLSALTLPIVLVGLRAAVQSDEYGRQLGWFALAPAMLLATCVIDRRISSATPDFPASLFITMAAWRALAIGLCESESKPILMRWNLLSIATLATAAVTMKTTVIFFAALAALALAAVLYRIARRETCNPIRTTTVQLAFMVPWTAVIFVPWVVRGYIFSGYPLFPSTFAAAPVDWLFDANAAAALRADIYAWARTAYFNVELGYRPGWGWVPHWMIQIALLRAPFEIVLPAAISVACIAWLVIRRKFANTDSIPVCSDRYFTASALAAAYAASLVAWFVTAPGPRMGSFAWWGLAATLLGTAFSTVPACSMTRYRRLITAMIASLCVLPMVDLAARIELLYRKNANLPEYGTHFYDFLPFVLPHDNDGFPPLPVGKIVAARTDSDLVVYVGAPRPDGKPELVWDSPLPSAYGINPNLSLRRSGDMQSGFKITSVNPADADQSTSR
jgi:hypothetical protein